MEGFSSRVVAVVLVSTNGVVGEQTTIVEMVCCGAHCSLTQSKVCDRLGERKRLESILNSDEWNDDYGTTGSIGSI